jgi:predicted small lipoprotein YifL
VRAALAIGLAVLLAGCGQSKPDPLPPACSNGPDEIVRALRDAPDHVALSDGTSLSDCVRQAFDDAEVQLLGYSFTPAADTLAGRATADAAFQLGYLLGAVRKGAGETNGVHLELVRRIEGTITFDDPGLLAAARRGAAEGERRG